MLELQHFGGLSLEEISEAMTLSIPTVRRDLVLAQAWLVRELGRQVPSLG